MRRTAVLALLIGCLALTAAGLVAGCRGESPPAIFLITVDTLRPDKLSSYGFDGGQTPHVDRLAAIGARFAEARAVASWTAPSMGAMLTSLYPTQLGLVESDRREARRPRPREKRDQRSWVLPESADTIAERLRRAGYATAAFVNQPALNEGGFAQGFAVWRTAEASQQNWGTDGHLVSETDRRLAGEFDLWLREERAGPIFAWIHLLTPHAPYISHLPSEPAPAGSDAARYEAEVRVADEIVGQLLDSIDREIGLMKAHIVFGSDHGEAFREHGPNDYWHGHSLHAQVTRVPLIVASERVARGSVVEEDVRTLDILPTILDLAGLPAAAGPPTEGQSLLAPASRAARVTYAEGMLYGPTERSLVREGFKLVEDDGHGGARLYDLRVDPAELHDLSAQRPQQTAEMRQMLIEHRERLESSAIEADRDVPPTPEMNEALRALGYVE